MLTNYHTHTNLCDGESTPEEIVTEAIKKGFDAIGFSGHGYTPYDLSYCMKNTDEYIVKINKLKEKYKKKIQVYLGIEEDSFSYVNRADFDYTIGSAHYILKDKKYYSIDSEYEYLKKCIELFDNDVLKFADSYYSCFCDYIKKRKPDIVGHFDLITKFDEVDIPMFSNNKDYLKLSKKYMEEMLKNDCLIEVNTGAISRGYKKEPYPCENLLYCVKRNSGKIILSSDSHHAKTLDFHFEETKKLLKSIGFEFVYVLYDNEFKKDYI